MQSDAAAQYIFSYFAQLIIGGIFGYLLGKLLRAVWKNNVFYAIGVIVVILMFLSVNNIVIVNWGAIQQFFSWIFSLNGLGNIMGGAVYNLPFATTFVGGFIYAFWYEKKK